LTVDNLDLLKGHVLFREMDPVLIEPIANLGIKRNLIADECLFVKGDDGDELYGVLSGCIRISARAQTGKEINLNILYPGDLFGEIALLDGKKRTADATATTSTELLCIRRFDFLNILKEKPDLAIHLLKIVCDRIRKTTEMVEDNAFLSLRPRLAKRLLNLARYDTESKLNGTSNVLNISQSELGQMMGVSRESINKCMQNWNNKKWVLLKRNQITILNRAALQQLIE
jgi:CRP/FNR family transcriptional regulator, cyclic AMP receptor protein